MTGLAYSPKGRDAEREAWQARKLEEEARRRRRVEDARDFCRPFLSDHLDVAAMSLILLRWEKPGVAITQVMVKARVRESYPWIEAA